MYTKKSIPKLDSAGAAPTPKDPNVLIFKTSDIDAFPARDANGVLSTSDLTLIAETKGIALYLTPSTIKRPDKSEGDDDAKGFIHMVEGEYPGDNLPFDEFVQNNINEDLILITKGCDGTADTRLHGSKCSPMKLAFDGQDDKDATKGKVVFTQSVRQKYKSMHYVGTIPAVEANAELVVPVEGV